MTGVSRRHRGKNHKIFKKNQHSGIWWLYLESPSDMHSDKYKHALYWFTYFLNILWNLRIWRKQNFFSSVKLNYINGRVRSVNNGMAKWNLMFLISGVLFCSSITQSNKLASSVYSKWNVLWVIYWVCRVSFHTSHVTFTVQFNWYILSVSVDYDYSANLRNLKLNCNRFNFKWLFISFVEICVIG